MNEINEDFCFVAEGHCRHRHSSSDNASEWEVLFCYESADVISDRVDVSIFSLTSVLKASIHIY